MLGDDKQASGSDLDDGIDGLPHQAFDDGVLDAVGKKAFVLANLDHLDTGLNPMQENLAERLDGNDLGTLDQIPDVPQGLFDDAGLYAKVGDCRDGLRDAIDEIKVMRDDELRECCQLEV